MRIRLKHHELWNSFPKKERRSFLASFFVCLSSIGIKEVVAWLLYDVHIFFNNDKLLWVRMKLSDLEFWLLLLFFVTLVTTIWYGGKLLILYDQKHNPPKPIEKPTAQTIVFNGTFNSFFALFVVTLFLSAGSLFEENSTPQQSLDTGIVWVDFMVSNANTLIFLLSILFGLLSLATVLWNFWRKIDLKVSFKW